MIVRRARRLMFAAFLLPALLGPGLTRADFEPAGFTRVETAAGSTLLVPRGAGERRPLLVLLPFTGGSAGDLLERWYADSLPRQARERGFMLLLPAAVGSADDYNTGSAWSATMARYERDLHADIGEAVAKYKADPARIALAGYSMGGDLAWALVQRDPERYSGAIVMGSRASFRAAGALERLTQRRVRVFYFMGESESRDRLAGAKAALQALERAGVPHRNASAAGAHVWAPPKILRGAVDYVLGYEDAATAASAGQAAAAATATVEPPPAAAVVERLPSCDWTPFEDDARGLSGYRDGRDRVALEPRFAWAGEFGADGLAPIAEKNRVGYVDCSGKAFYVMNYDNGPDAFREGLARFEDNGRVGYVNRRGEVVIPPRFENAAPFCGGLARIGRACANEAVGEHRLRRCREEYFVDLRGNRVPTPDDPPEPPACGATAAKDIPARLPRCGWAPYLDKSSGLYGYRDAAGKVVVNPRFSVAGMFGDDGVAAIREGGWSVGYLTCTGKSYEVLFDGGADSFHDDLVRVEVDGAYGFLNRRGETVVPARYSFATPFCAGIAKVGDGCSIERERDSLRLDHVECARWRYIGRDGRERRVSEMAQRCEAVLTEPGSSGADEENEEPVDNEDAGDEYNDEEEDDEAEDD